MRKFYLENDAGVIFNFDYENQVLVSSISGLGFQKDLNYLDFNNIYKKQLQKNPLSSIDIELIFLDGYKGYSKFIKYIEGSEGFKLYYKSDDLKYSFVEIESLSKTELEATVLKCSLKLQKLSVWFKNITKQINIVVSESGKVYPFVLPYAFSESYKGITSFTNSGYTEAPLKIIISGAFNNPEIVVSKNNKELKRTKIYYSSSDAILTIDSFPTKQKITIEENGKFINGYEFQDFTCENFLFLDRGTFDIEFRPNINGTPNCVITMVEGYLGN